MTMTEPDATQQPAVQDAATDEPDMHDGINRRDFLDRTARVGTGVLSMVS